jgi:hypothetical protein
MTNHTVYGAIIFLRLSFYFLIDLPPDWQDLIGSPSRDKISAKKNGGMVAM